MLFITLDKLPVRSRVELDGVDISSRLCRVQLDADRDGGLTRVTLTIVDQVAIAGEAGVLEFIKHAKGTA